VPVHKHFRIVFRGVFVGTPEIWSFSTKWRNVQDSGPDADLSDISDEQVTNAIGTYINSSDFQTIVRATEWRAYLIGTDGKMDGDPKIVVLDTPGPTGTGSARAYPTDVALCVTTVADHRGHGRYGRFYVPGPHAELGSDRLIALSWLEPFLAHTQTFLESISSAIDLPDSLASSGMQNISNDAASTQQGVDHLKVGRVLDHISRRRSAMLEDYLEGPQIDW
jgi:hypothetical protein